MKGTLEHPTSLRGTQDNDEDWGWGSRERTDHEYDRPCHKFEIQVLNLKTLEHF